MTTGLSAYRALSSASKVAVLVALQQHGEAQPVAAVAREVGLHVNTVRAHLEALVAGGLAERVSERRTSRGRPRVLYLALGRPEDDEVRERLAQELVGGFGVQVDSVAAAAQAAGRRWAADLQDVSADPGSPDGRAVGPDDGARQIAALGRHLVRMGFDPEPDPDAEVVRLRRCPFEQLARQRTEVVCAVHLGLASGILEQVGGPLRADRLEPFVAPSLCLLHLRTDPPDDKARRRADLPTGGSVRGSASGRTPPAG